jgi:chitodextrinase
LENTKTTRNKKNTNFLFFFFFLILFFERDVFLNKYVLLFVEILGATGMRNSTILLSMSLVFSLVCCSGCLNQEQPAGHQNTPPEASCTGVPTNGTAPLKVAFTGVASDSDGIITFYHWDFGDGSIADLQNPSHIYLHDGTYTVTFTVTDNNASTTSSTMQVSVLRPSNYPPNASISVDRTFGVAPLTVAFSGSGSDADGYIVSYSWDFGDGSTSYSQSTGHTFVEYGIYNVTLVVTDNQGASDGAFLMITCAPVHNLTQGGIDYICQHYGSGSGCIVSEGLIFTFTDDTNQTYSELPGGTSDILGFIMIGVVESITMIQPSRMTITDPLQEFLKSNGGFMLDSGDVAFLLQHDETSGDQWCHPP